MKRSSAQVYRSERDNLVLMLVGESGTMVSMMVVVNQRDLFQSAAQHMAYDTQQLDRQPDWLAEYYRWPTPSVTYTYKQTLPPELAVIDHAQRYTGGGMVFHCPGDIVVCCVAVLDHPDLPKKLKDKVAVTQRHIQAALARCGVTTQLNPDAGPRDLMFCQAYHSPYELYYHGQKIVALSLRCTRTHCLIQGIIHLQPTRRWFSLSKGYESVAVHRVPDVDVNALLAQLHA
ncbi:MAG: hypothetical protein O3A77_01305 [bacterium]|nr:hypothetical protein [bacterium]